MRDIRNIIRRYGLFGSIRLLLDIAHTRFRFAGARLVRRPAYVRGRAHIRLGHGFTAGVGLRLDAFPSIKHGVCIEIGNNVQLNDYVHIAAVESVKIGNGVLVASKVFITDHNHGHYAGDAGQDSPGVPPAERPLDSRGVQIDDNVWLGEFVVILPGVKIGAGTIVGAMSVVTGALPPYCIAVGAPARVIKQYNFATKRWEHTKKSSS